MYEESKIESWLFWAPAVVIVSMLSPIAVLLAVSCFKLLGSH